MSEWRHRELMTKLGIQKPLEMIDWSDRFPNEDSRTIAFRQSTLCLCGKPKEIGVMKCGSCLGGES
jgi:hypothetical protein